MKQAFLSFLIWLVVNGINAQSVIKISSSPGAVIPTVNSLLASFPVQHSYRLSTGYLKKSRTQKTFGWILTGVGVTIVTIGALTQDYVDAFTGLAYKKNTTSPVTYAVGGACIAGGVLLFVASAKNKKRAATTSLSFRVENAVTCRKSYSYPAAALTIGLY